MDERDLKKQQILIKAKKRKAKDSLKYLPSPKG